MCKKDLGQVCNLFQPFKAHQGREASVMLLILTLAFSSLMIQLKTSPTGMNANSAQSLIQGLFVLLPRSLKEYGWKQIIWSLQMRGVSKILSTTEILTSLVGNISICSHCEGISFFWFCFVFRAYPKTSLTQSVQSLLRSLRRLEAVSIHIWGSQKKRHYVNTVALPAPWSKSPSID